MSAPGATMDTSESVIATAEGKSTPLDILLSKYDEAVNCSKKMNECLDYSNMPPEAESLCASMRTALKNVLELEEDPVFKEHLELMSKITESIEKTITTPLIERPEQVMSLSSSSIAGGPKNPKESVQKGKDTHGQTRDKVRERADSRQEIIVSTQIPKNDVTLKDIVGLEEAKKILQKTILLPLRMPELFQGRGKTWNHVLFYGPPGTGKTKLASAIANEANVPLFSLSNADILSAYIGESEKMIQDLFAHAKNKKCIVFIDEVDCLFRRRSSKEPEHSRSLKNQLLLELDRNVSKDNVVICATNCPWEIDSAFMRRFHCRLYVPLPDRGARCQILANTTIGVPLSLCQADWDILADRTEGYSGSDLINLANFAIQEPISELISCEYWIQRRDDKKWSPCSVNVPGSIKTQLTELSSDAVYMREVGLEDFLKGLRVTPKSVPSGELDKYMKFMGSK